MDQQGQDEQTSMVAQVIFDRLGAGDFVLKTGARDMVGTFDSLRLRLRPTTTPNGGTHLEVRVNGHGFYDARLIRAINGGEPTQIDAAFDVPAEEIRARVFAMIGVTP